MEKEYIKPDAELVKFVEEEEIMANAPGMAGGTLSYTWGDISQTAL